MTTQISNVQKIVRYAVNICEDYRDVYGEVNLTQIEEAVMEHFDLPDSEFEDNDISFIVYRELERQKLL